MYSHFKIGETINLENSQYRHPFYDVTILDINNNNLKIQLTNGELRTFNIDDCKISNENIFQCNRDTRPKPSYSNAYHGNM